MAQEGMDYRATSIGGRPGPAFVWKLGRLANVCSGRTAVIHYKRSRYGRRHSQGVGPEDGVLFTTSENDRVDRPARSRQPVSSCYAPGKKYCLRFPSTSSRNWQSYSLNFMVVRRRRWLIRAQGCSNPGCNGLFPLNSERVSIASEPFQCF